MKTTGKLTTILLLTLLWSQSVYSNHELTKNPKSDANGTELYRDIEFTSQDAILRGRLYLPENKSKKSPVIIMAHGFTTTINGMTADKYAERYREAGFAVLLYDHRNLGISDGEPRRDVNFWVQSRGYIDCIDFVSSLSEIDITKIAVWGASMSAQEAFLVGSIDERVKAFVLMIPGFESTLPAEDKDGKLYAFAKKTVLSERIMDMSHTVIEPMPIVSSDQLGTPSVLTEISAYRWFIEYGGRFGTNWDNVVSYSDVERPELYHTGQCAPHIKAPVLMIVATNDEMEGANPEVTLDIYKKISQPKEWVDIDGGHFGLLHYPSALFDKSSKAQITFLNRYLK
ncbi:MAG: alpha/beta hydrolase [Chlorobi bacterium]|nr:alpha/beta hydrolase [Chlorobiota bacterium]